MARSLNDGGARVVKTSAVIALRRSELENSNLVSNVVSQKFKEKHQTAAPAEVVLQTPLFPLFRRGNFVRRTLTPLWKRGEGPRCGRRQNAIRLRISETGILGGSMRIRRAV